MICAANAVLPPAVLEQSNFENKYSLSLKHFRYGAQSRNKYRLRTHGGRLLTQTPEHFKVNMLPCRAFQIQKDPRLAGGLAYASMVVAALPLNHEKSENHAPAEAASAAGPETGPPTGRPEFGPGATGATRSSGGCPAG